jgi:ABC-2 type transport system permease protein
MERIKPLVRKELRQTLRTRGALLSTTLLPILLLVIVPGFQLVSILAATGQGQPISTRTAGAPMPEVFTDAHLLVARFVYPLFLTLGGMIVPGVAATYTIVGERERRSLELLVALPVRVQDILTAKLLAMLVLTGAVVLPLFALDIAVLSALGFVSVLDIAELLAALVGSLAYAVGVSLLLALLARDLRTAQNLNGALLVPVTALAGTLLVVLPAGISLLAVAGVLLLGAAMCVTIGLRWLTFERYLL